MEDKLIAAENRLSEIEEKLADPGIGANQDEYRQLMRERKALFPVVSKFRELCGYRREYSEARELAAQETDAEMREFASEEAKTAKLNAERAEEELKLLLLPRDPNDDKNVVVEIRAGAGGEEACLFASVIFRMYCMYAESAGFKTERISETDTELGGFREIVFTVSGDGAYSRFKFESGVHRVQRVPETEAQGRIHTSTITVAVLPEAEEVDVVIDPSELVIETCKSSGAGGQHINKTESAIRIIHKPSGMVVECQEERSQYKNRDKAMKLLRTRLLEKKRGEQQESISSARRGMIGTGDRSEKIRTYNYPQSRVTDHRIGYTTHALEQFLNGEMGGMIDALIAAEAAERLKNGTAVGK